jgi:uncharacterized membrane protein
MRDPARDRSWIVATARLLALLGAAQILAGVVFFFAANWAGLVKWQKLGVLEAALLVLILVARWQGMGKLSGRLFLLAAAIITGVVLGVYGQLYQTGADAWQLFALWAALITGWAVMARSGALWITWIVLVNIAVILWFGAMQSVIGWQTDIYFLILAALNAAFLGARETLAQYYDWAHNLWTRWLIFTAALSFVTLAAAFQIALGLHDSDASMAINLTTYAVIIAAAYIWHRRRAHDIAVFVLTALSIAVIVTIVMWRLLNDAVDDSGVLVFMAATVLTVFGSTGWWTAREYRALGTRGTGQGIDDPISDSGAPGEDPK